MFSNPETKKTCQILGCWVFLRGLVSASAFSIDTTQNHNLNRRTALANLATVPTVTSLLSSIPLLTSPTVASAESSNICTVVIDSPNSASRVGIQFVDIKIDAKEVPSVDRVEPNSLAAKSGVKPGMVVLARDSATKSSSRNVDFRLRNGPYPFILQFATPDDMNMLMTSSKNLESQVEALDPYGRLVVRSLQKPESCDGSARRGDTVTISYEARISSSNGSVYDSTAWRQGEPATFELGRGAAVPGVEIGLNGMCVGEVREIDVPTALGYGRYGSQVFDVPGDVRLWWRVELLNLTKGQKKYHLF
ncbi:hypothetical protein HJC23_009641 [Cyclotella cryptica]|uniref:peptidylprolyl isomerase n=1 Tax=Cyclotella cryptica TaxID=29204 RepID=A0ABD3PVY8_9STRA|eukprot:CCRYP_010903-RA/>CCRYP_010903-RA protein AED:0.37 eAED:-0.87 QI:0/-1/0/1/-1/1/1/0/305